MHFPLVSHLTTVATPKNGSLRIPGTRPRLYVFPCCAVARRPPLSAAVPARVSAQERRSARRNVGKTSLAGRATPRRSLADPRPIRLLLDSACAARTSAHGHALHDGDDDDGSDDDD